MTLVSLLHVLSLLWLHVCMTQSGPALIHLSSIPTPQNSPRLAPLRIREDQQHDHYHRPPAPLYQGPRVPQRPIEQDDDCAICFEVKTSPAMYR